MATGIYNRHPDFPWLSAKQGEFVVEWLKDFNSTQAYARAGYQAKPGRSRETAAAHLLGNVKVQRAIKQALAARAARTRISADRVLLEYARLAFSDMRAFTKWGPDGVTLNEAAQLSDDDAACVSEVTQTLGKDGAGSLRFKLHDKKGALDAVAKHLGLFLEQKPSAEADDESRGHYDRDHNYLAALLRILEELGVFRAEPAHHNGAGTPAE
jgi:phage terminase small subunit